MLDLFLLGIGVAKCLIFDGRPAPKRLPSAPVTANDTWWRAYHGLCIQRAAMAHDMEGRAAKWN